MTVDAGLAHQLPLPRRLRRLLKTALFHNLVTYEASAKSKHSGHAVLGCDTKASRIDCDGSLR